MITIRAALFGHRLSQRQPTGIGRFTQELVRALSIVVDDSTTIVLASTREESPPAWVPRNIEVSVVNWPRRPVQLSWCLGLGPKLEREIGNIDVALLMQPFPPVKTDARQVAVIHDLFPFEHPDWYRPSERWTYHRSIKLILQRADMLAVPSRYIADRLNALLGVDTRMVEVVHNGVSGTFASQRPHEEISTTCARFGLNPDGYTLSLGAVSTRKNVITLVRAMTLISDPVMPLVLVGPDGHGSQEVDAEIARLKGRATVLRTGFLSDDETAALVQGAAVVLHPTLGEGFGMVPLEAMAAGTPVVAAGVSSVPEVVGDAAILVLDPTEPRAWADAIQSVIRDPARRDALIAAGAERVASFNWEHTGRAILDLCASVAANG